MFTNIIGIDYYLWYLYLFKLSGKRPDYRPRHRWEENIEWVLGRELWEHGRTGAQIRYNEEERLLVLSS